MLWRKYDVEATGFMAVTDLEDFLLDMAKSADSKGIIVLHELLIKDENHRKRFIGKLNIPTYYQFRKVMFYDVL